MISLFFSPLGRYVTMGGGILVILVGIYLKIRADAVEGMKARAQSVNLDPERLRDTDGHRRD